MTLDDIGQNIVRTVGLAVKPSEIEVQTSDEGTRTRKSCSSWQAATKGYPTLKSQFDWAGTQDEDKQNIGNLLRAVACMICVSYL